MILYVALAVVIIGVAFLSGVLAIAKATDSFNNLMEGDK